MRTTSTVSLALIVVACLTPGLAGQEKPLTNNDVVQLMKLGLGEAVVIAKVKQTREVDFRLETDALVELKVAGVSSSVIAAMLERSSPSAATAISSGSTSADEAILVRIVASEKEVYLRMRRGTFVSRGMAAFTSFFMNYTGRHANVRVVDSVPYLLVKSPDPVEGARLFLVRLEVDESSGVRSLKLGSFKQRLKFFKAEEAMQPDKDRQITVAVTQVSEGLWKVAPVAPLPPGEYGYYVDPGFLVGCERQMGLQRQLNAELGSESSRKQAGALFDFAVD